MVKRQAVLEPAADEITPRPAHRADLGVASTSTKVPRPTASAGLLPIHLSLQDELPPPLFEWAAGLVSERKRGVVDCTMTCEVMPLRADRHVRARSSAG